MEISFVRFLIHDINLGSTSDSFGWFKRSVCVIPHFFTTEKQNLLHVMLFSLVFTDPLISEKY